MSILRRRVVVVAALLIGVSLGSTAAVATFSTTGGGSGAGTSGATVAVTLAAGTVSGDLIPGGTAAVRTVATNPNAGPVRIESLALDTTQGAGGFSVSRPGCAASSFAFTPQSNAGAGWTVPGNGSLTITLASAIGMNLAAADACQGAVVTVFLRAGS